jgi:hypothetical protein
MTSNANGPEAGGTDSAPQSNGLLATSYVPLTDVQAEVGQQLLTALGRARIAAYLAPLEGSEQQRLFVNADERADARTIVAAAVRASDEPGPPSVPAPEPRPDPLDGVDTDQAFAALIADWHVDTVAAIRAAERDLSREDADWRAGLEQPPAEEPLWLDDDHYVPPPPPPLPRLALPTVLAMLLMVVSVLILALGDQIGFDSNFTLLLGIGGLLVGAAILVMRLREDRDEDEDDGAVL